jgi:hypothetical protein
MTDQPTKGRGDRPACPACTSPDVLTIVYGKPAPGVKGSLGAPGPDDEVALGGCNIWPSAPAWKCRACRHCFGTLAERSPEMFEEICHG